MRVLRFAVALLMAGTWSPITARASEAPRDLLDQILPPDIVLEHADTIGLTPAQRNAVQKVQRDLQPRMWPLIAQIRQERDALMALLAQDQPDEAAVLAQFEKLNAAETELKRLRFRMTLGVKTALRPEQQAQATSLHAERLARAGATPGPSLQARLTRVKEGLEQWRREGRDVTPLRLCWEQFREAEQKGHYRRARQALDEAIALLDAPSARP